MREGWSKKSVKIELVWDILQAGKVCSTLLLLLSSKGLLVRIIVFKKVVGAAVIEFDDLYGLV